MGVTGLWPLLEPVGRRVNIETLAGKKVAIGEECFSTSSLLVFFFAFASSLSSLSSRVLCAA
jgi:hypothetical protein